MEDLLKDALREEMYLRWKEQLKAQGNGTEFTTDEASVVPIRRRVPWSALAIAAMVILGVGFWYVNQEAAATGINTAVAEQLALQYFEPLPNTVAPNMRGVSTADSLQYALYAYELGANFPQNYKTAVDLMSGLRDRGALPDNVRIYLGVSQLAIDQPAAAAATLAALEDPDAQWYQMLALFRINEVEAGVNLLQQIVADTQHPYQQLAEALLIDLRRE